MSDRTKSQHLLYLNRHQGQQQLLQRPPSSSLSSLTTTSFSTICEVAKETKQNIKLSRGQLQLLTGQFYPLICCPYIAISSVSTRPSSWYFTELLLVASKILFQSISFTKKLILIREIIAPESKCNSAQVNPADETNHRHQLPCPASKSDIINGPTNGGMTNSAAVVAIRLTFVYTTSTGYNRNQLDL